jgi:hypothetical protein
MMLGTYLFGLQNISQAGSGWWLVAAAAHLFSQCNVVWINFQQVEVQGVEVLFSLVLYFHQV